MKEQSRLLSPSQKPRKGRLKPIPLVILFLAIMALGYKFDLLGLNDIGDTIQDITEDFGVDYYNHTTAYYGLKGTVKSVTKLHHDAEPNRSSDPNHYPWKVGDLSSSGENSKMRFRSNGALKYLEALDDKGKKLFEFTPHYEKGKLMSMEVESGSQKGFSYKYQYPSNDAEIKETYIPSGVLIGKETYHREGNLLKKMESHYINEKETGVANFHGEITYLYNEKGLNVLETMIPNDGSFKSITKYEYLEFDKQGNWTLAIAIDATRDYPNHMIVRTIEYY